MKPSHQTPTTFERYSTRNQTRQIVTVLSTTPGGMLLCSVESVAFDGREIPDYIVWIARRGIPTSILSRITTNNTTKGT
jgi:hypothetical protein